MCVLFIIDKIQSMADSVSLLSYKKFSFFLFSVFLAPILVLRSYSKQSMNTVVKYEIYSQIFKRIYDCFRCSHF